VTVVHAVGTDNFPTEDAEPITTDTGDPPETAAAGPAVPARIVPKLGGTTAPAAAEALCDTP
jgi:hypothetical protein